MSFSDRAGRSTGVLGRLTPLCDERVPLFSVRTRTFVPSMERTSRDRIPMVHVRYFIHFNGRLTVPSST